MTDWTQTPEPTTGLIGTPAVTPDVTQATTQASDAIPATQAAQTTADVQTVAAGDTVSGSLDKMLAADSPYLQRAQAKSLETSNARGLLNSSMAAGAGTAAAIDAAAPIAQGDANIAMNTRNQNQAALNSTGQFNASSANQFTLTDKQIQANKEAAATQQGFDLSKMSVQQQNDLERLATSQGYTLQTMTAQQINDLAKLDKSYTQADKEAQAKFGYDKQLMELQKSSNIEVANIEAQYRTLIQVSTAAASMSNVVNQNINAVLLNEKLDATAKQNAINQIKTNYQNSLQLIGAMSGDVDLGAMIDSILVDSATPTTPTTPTTPATPMDTSAANFDAAAYLKANPDVANKSAWSGTPYQHYLQYGKAEGRAFIPLK